MSQKLAPIYLAENVAYLAVSLITYILTQNVLQLILFLSGIDIVFIKGAVSENKQDYKLLV